MTEEQPAKRYYFTKKRLWATLVVFVIGSVGLVLAGNQFISLTQPPAEGVFRSALEGPEGLDSNVTNTLFEDTVDELSGNRVPILLFAGVTNYCLEPVGGYHVSAACVSRFNPNHIAVREEFSNRLSEAWEDARDAELLDEAEKINSWESHLAAHEFAHILQYNYRAETLPYLDVFGYSEIPAVELMAECYANIAYPMESVVMEFYTFPEPESFPLCTDAQDDATKEWASAIGWPIPGV